ncbi:MAG: hypothetical protein WBG02_17310 [Candidatus Acidiferrum sp.]
MNKRSISILTIGVLLLSATAIRAQDYSAYRGFSLGASLTTVLKQTDQKLGDVNVVHAGPSPIQELTWWPPNLRGISFRSDSVEQILFSFHDGTLYKMTVTYDRGSTEGLTSGDMVKSVSTKYGPATSVAPVVDPSSKDSYDAKETLVASWEDAKYSLSLVRSSFTGLFGLIIYSKQANAEAELAIAEALLLDKQNGPKNAAELAKQQSDDLEVAR